jgi:hypothetical protein
MGTSVALAILIATTHLGATIPQIDIRKQEQIYQKHWGVDFSWKFEDLPEKGSVPGYQVPYSGYIYPDNSGGTIPILRKYDRAFHLGRMPATAFEEWDVKAYKGKVDVRGPLGMRWGSRMAVPDWSGHCNGWAAAAIRHAEPQQSVVRNGVVFTPSDIKGLLAELYIYNDIEDLSGSGSMVNAGVFHAVVSNWLGRGRHSLGMEAEPGEEKWNYPIYAYNSDFARRSPRHVEVKMNLGYLKDSNREYEESPKVYRVKYFHYLLDLDAAGSIVGGRFYPDSSVIDMLWLPLQPKAGRQPGNESGNPYLNVQQVLAIWRDSVPAELREKWVVVDPTRWDNHLVVSNPDMLVPTGYQISRVESHIADDDTPAEEPSDNPRVVVQEEWSADTDDTPLVTSDQPAAEEPSATESSDDLTSAPAAGPIVIAGRPPIQVRQPTEEPSVEEPSMSSEPLTAEEDAVLDAEEALRSGDETTADPGDSETGDEEDGHDWDG